MEIWKNLETHNYEISNYGNVRRIGSLKNLNFSISNSGYKMYHLYKNAVRTHFYAHVLVAEYFIKKVEGKNCVNHKDGIKTNCFVENLEWVNHSENNIHALKNDLRKAPKGQDFKSSKLTDQNVRDIRKTIGILTNNQASEKFGVSRSVISNIRTNKAWKHV